MLTLIIIFIRVIKNIYKAVLRGAANVSYRLALLESSRYSVTS